MIPNYPRGKRIINYGAKLSEIEKDFIRANAKVTTVKQLAELLNKSYSLIYEYCKKAGIEYKGSKPTGRPRNEDRAKRDSTPIFRRSVSNSGNGSVKFTRPPAKYDNRSQDDVIDYYLKSEI